MIKILLIVKETVDKQSLKGPMKIKIWLESKGKREFSLAVGKISFSDLKELQSEVESRREDIEMRWVQFMLENKWLEAKLKGTKVLLVAYPNSHNSYEREINLKQILPGAFPGWGKKPPKVEFDEENGLLTIGNQENKDHRTYVDVTQFLFS